MFTHPHTPSHEQHSLTHSLTHTRTHDLASSLTHARTHELTNSRTDSLVCCVFHALLCDEAHSLRHAPSLCTAQMDGECCYVMGGNAQGVSRRWPSGGGEGEISLLAGSCNAPPEFPVLGSHWIFSLCLFPCLFDYCQRERDACQTFSALAGESLVDAVIRLTTSRRSPASSMPQRPRSAQHSMSTAPRTSVLMLSVVACLIPHCVCTHDHQSTTSHARDSLEESGSATRGSPRLFATAADKLLREQQLLSRFRSTSEHALANAAFAHSQSFAQHRQSATSRVAATYGPPMSQQCCRICSTEDDVGLGITSFVEEQENLGPRKTAQPLQCNTSWVNYQLCVLLSVNWCFGGENGGQPLCLIRAHSLSLTFWNHVCLWHVGTRSLWKSPAAPFARTSTCHL